MAAPPPAFAAFREFGRVFDKAVIGQLTKVVARDASVLTKFLGQGGSGRGALSMEAPEHALAQRMSQRLESGRIADPPPFTFG